MALAQYDLSSTHLHHIVIMGDKKDRSLFYRIEVLHHLYQLLGVLLSRLAAGSSASNSFGLAATIIENKEIKKSDDANARWFET